MMLLVTILVLGVLAANCSELRGDDGIITELTTAIEKVEARMEARMTEAELKMSKEMQKITGELRNIAADNEQVKGKIEDFENYLVSTQTGSSVSFSAYAEIGYQNPDSGDIITFPVVMTNSGDHYNPSSSIFTCPLNGTYFFGFSLYTYHLSDPEFTSALIQIGGEQLSEAFCQIDGPDWLYTQCGNSVVAHCNQGQQVFITSRHSSGQLYGSYKRTTFSGFLLHADIPAYYS